MRITVPEPVSGGLLLSYRCSAECLHCMYACAPSWSSDWISENDLFRILKNLSGRILASPGGPERVSLNYGLHYTGGEPFLNFELLLNACRISTELGIPSTFVETNCFWCSDDGKTREMLLLLRGEGLKGMLVSVNPFYLEYVPFERTRRAVRIGYEIFGSNLMVYQHEYYRRFSEEGIEGRVSFSDYLKLEGGENILRNVEFFMMGRAAYRLGGNPEMAFPRYLPEHLIQESCHPSFKRNWHNHFDNYGNYVPGYCGGISFGDVRELEGLIEEGIDPATYPVLALLMNEDLEGLLRLAAEHGYDTVPEGYLSRCHLCTDIRRRLVETDSFRELRPVEFYTHLV